VETMTCKVNGRPNSSAQRSANNPDTQALCEGGRQGLYVLKRQLEGTPVLQEGDDRGYMSQKGNWRGPPFCRGGGTTGVIFPKKATGGDPRFGRRGTTGALFPNKATGGTPECKLNRRSRCFTTLGDDGRSKKSSIQLVYTTGLQTTWSAGYFAQGDVRGYPKKATGGDPGT
jgi:hypothetical protein